MRPLGLYIHIPFCKSFCPYCDFYKVRVDDALMKKYTEAVVKTTASFSHFLGRDKYIVDTIYFGGGTPSAMDGIYIAEILDCIRENFYVSHNPEITVECNPSSNLEVFIPIVADAGVNRVSLGLQSAVDEERKLLGRISDRSGVSKAIDVVRNSGIDNISLDVMLGIPEQTQAGIIDTLNFCFSSEISHLSAYILKIEEGTNFYKRKSILALPNEDEVCNLYETTCDMCENAGFYQYEISNFAKPGFESRHNLKYWNCEEYLGIGPAAHSFINGSRFYFEKDIDSFIENSVSGENFPTWTYDGKGGDYNEKLMLSLRLKDGIKDLSLLKPETIERAKQPKFCNYLQLDDKGLRLTRSGFLVSNYIISELLF